MVSGLTAVATDFRDSRLNDTDFAGADLSFSWFNGAQMARSNLTDASIAGARLWNARLVGTKPVRIDARYVDLFAANLRGADDAYVAPQGSRGDKTPLLLNCQPSAS